MREAATDYGEPYLPNCTVTDINCVDHSNYYVPDCTDPRNLFRSPQNFAACIVVPNATRYFKESTLPYPGFATGLGFSHDRTIGQSAIGLVSECLPQWCNDSAACQKKDIGLCSRASITSNSTLLFEPVYDCLEAICSDRNAEAPPASQEIAGIGIVISYYIQVAITILGLLSLWYCKSKASKYGGNSQGPIATRSKFERLLETIMERLVDLQKAQCYFALALELAGFIFLSDPEGSNYVDVAALTNAARAGFLPLEFNFLTLCIHAQPELYLSVLTMTVEFMGLVLGLICYHRINRAIGPVACGYHVAWTLRIEAWKTAGLESAVVVNTIGIVVWLISGTLLVFSCFKIRHWRPIGFHTLQLAVFGLLGVHVYTIRVTQYNMTKQSEWSFGQVIAVTIWLPVVAEFGYNILKHWQNPEGEDPGAPGVKVLSATASNSESGDNSEAKNAASQNADLESQTKIMKTW